VKNLHRLSTAAFALAASVALSPSAQAQATCGTTGAAGVTCAPAATTAATTVSRIIFLSVNPAAAALTAPTDVDFAGGGTTNKTDVAAHVLTVRTNANWTLTVKGAAWTGTGNNAKPISDLAWSKTGAAPFTAMTTTAVTVNTGAATASTITTLAYQTAWALVTDTPGTYVMALTFTLTAP
jgi:hypothetical protein